LRKLIGVRRSLRACIACRARLYAAVALAATSLSPAALVAQGAGGDDGGPGPVATVLADAKDYVTAPLRARGAQWARFGAALGAVVLARRYDDDVREHFGTVTAAPGTSPDTRDAADAAPALLALGGVWAAAVVGDDDDGRREAGTMLEAAALSGAAGRVLKEVARRERPYATADAAAWREDGDAFPSLHAATAFAIGTVLAESGNDERRRLRRVAGYGLAVATAYRRMDHDAHWLSDTVAGAGLGIATARFVMQQRERDAGRMRLGIAPLPNGAEVHYMVVLRR
jgi:membrane-associated phospholipid phosphatase